MRIHQHEKKGETREDKFDRKGNEAADKAAVKARKTHMTPTKDLMRMEMQKAYVKEFLEMTGSIVIVLSADEAGDDHQRRASIQKGTEEIKSKTKQNRKSPPG